MKPCRQCKEYRPDDQFYQWRHVCKRCQADNQRKVRRFDEPAFVNSMMRKWGRP